MIKKIKPSSPDIYLGKTIADNTLARIAHVNQLADQINNELAVVRPYKVYTALLTQNGADDPLIAYSGDTLTIGVTYIIINNSESYILGDFTNVGAPNNNINTAFVATGTTPNDWGLDIYLIYNSGAPVVTVLENTIGNVWFTYNGVGTSEILTNGLLPVNKTTFFISNIIPDTATPSIIEGKTYDGASLLISSFNPDGLITGVFIPTNDLLLNTPIEIRVYN